MRDEFGGVCRADRRAGRERAQRGGGPGANCGAQARRVVVGGVVIPRPARAGAECEGIGAGDAEHGADEDRAVWAERAFRAHGGEAGWSGAADEPHEQGFELVIGVVGHGDERAVVEASEIGERTIAECACGGLGVAADGANAHFLLDKRKIERGGERGGGVAVGMCFAPRAKIVHDVGDDQAVGGGGEREGKSGGIGAA